MAIKTQVAPYSSLEDGCGKHATSCCSSTRLKTFPSLQLSYSGSLTQPLKGNKAQLGFDAIVLHSGGMDSSLCLALGWRLTKLRNGDAASPCANALFEKWCGDGQKALEQLKLAQEIFGSCPEMAYIQSSSKRRLR